MELTDKDGFIPQIFTYLWNRDPISKEIISVMIPHTIIYENSVPIQWYFTHEKRVKTKSKSKLGNVKQFFLSLNSKSGIIAEWIEETENGKIRRDYFDKEQLKHFFKDQRIKQGVLQQFIHPKGNYNLTIRCIWATKICFFEKCLANYPLYDQSKDVYQRAITTQLLNQQPLIGSYMPAQLESLTSCIVQHLQNLQPLSVKRLILYYKIDENDNIYFMNCESMRIETSKKKAVYNVDKKTILPLSVDKYLFQNGPIRKQYKCMDCEIQLAQSKVYCSKIKNVIQSWQLDHLGKANTNQIKTQKPFFRRSKNKKATLFTNIKNKRASISPKKEYQNQDPQPGLPMEIEQNYLVPDLIRKIFPRMKFKKYKELIENPGFLEFQIDLCEKCHLKIDKAVNIKEDISKLAKFEQKNDNQFKGTQALNPDKLKKLQQFKMQMEKEEQKLEQKKVEHTKSYSASQLLYPILKTRFKPLNFQKLECNTLNYGGASTTRRTSQMVIGNKKDYYYIE